AVDEAAEEAVAADSPRPGVAERGQVPGDERLSECLRPPCVDEEIRWQPVQELEELAVEQWHVEPDADPTPKRERVLADPRPVGSVEASAPRRPDELAERAVPFPGCEHSLDGIATKSGFRGEPAGDPIQSPPPTP